MTRIRLVGILLVLVWLLALGIALQPRQHRPPPIQHGRPLAVTVQDLPTLRPLKR